MKCRLGNIRPIFYALAVSAVLMVSGCEKRAERVSLQEGQAAPSFQLRDVDGNLWSLSGLRGSVVLINFWASWCPPCKEEMPSLNKLFENTIEIEKITILTILFKDDPVQTTAYARGLNYTFPILKDLDSAAASAYGLTGVPETFIVDKNGVLRKKIIGPMGFDSPNVIGYLKQLAAE
jgi:peroxiredoxin